MGNVLEAMNKGSKQNTDKVFKGKAKIEPVKVSSHQRKELKVLDSKDVDYSPSLVVWHKPCGKISEQYRVLRNRLLAYYKDRPFAVMVTSAQAGEGKTVTCLNLAFSLASLEECRTIVVDCDFRRRKMGKMLGNNVPIGLADVLKGKATVDEVVRPTPYSNVSVIMAGKAENGDMEELISRAELDDVVRHLRRHYDFVLFDTPPVNAVSDAGVIGRVAGEALLVLRMNKTRRESVKAAIEHLEPLHVKIAGLVLTGQKYFIPNYLYRCS